jgi:hypothetical protein
MPYLLDANVFIEAKNRHYGLDFCPAFWDWIVEKHNQGSVFSINKIGGELRDRKDELCSWLDGLGDGFFLEEQDSLQPCLQRVSTWTVSHVLPGLGHYRPDAVATFLSKADYYLVSQALDRAFAVVTHEKAADSPTKVKIPNACKGVNVRFLTPYEMLREQHARFVLPRD